MLVYASGLTYPLCVCISIYIRNAHKIFNKNIEGAQEVFLDAAGDRRRRLGAAWVPVTAEPERNGKATATRASHFSRAHV